MIRYPILLVVIFHLFGVACGSVATRPAQPPHAGCPSKAIATMATLCVEGVSPRLGPVDQIESYDAMPEFQLLILPRTLAQSLFPKVISSPMVLGSPISQLGKSSSRLGDLPTSPSGVPNAVVLARVSKGVTATPTALPERCIQQFAPSAARTPRFHSGPVVTSRCTVAIASVE